MWRIPKYNSFLISVMVTKEIGWTVFLEKDDAEVLTLDTCECDLTWK